MSADAYHSMLYVAADLLQTKLTSEGDTFEGETKRDVKFGPGVMQVPLSVESDELSNNQVSFRLRFSGDLGGYLIVTAARKARLYMFDATIKNLMFSRSVEKIEPFLKANSVGRFELHTDTWNEVVL